MKEQNAAKFERPHVIYSIDDPETGSPLYIGQTVNYKRRIKEHLKLRPGASSAVFLEPMIAAGFEPIFKIIAIVDNRKKADARETEEIQKAIAAGHELFNATSELNLAAKKLKKSARNK